jgi:hypothetical protein
MNGPDQGLEIHDPLPDLLRILWTCGGLLHAYTHSSAASVAAEQAASPSAAAVLSLQCKGGKAQQQQVGWRCFSAATFAALLLVRSSTVLDVTDILVQLMAG